MNVIQFNLNWSAFNLTESEKNLLLKHTSDVSVWNDIENQNILNNLFSRVPPTQQSIELYSGAEFPLDTFKFNKKLGLKYFTSSYDLQVASKYAKLQYPTQACLFIINVPIGSKILCLNLISIHKGEEREVILSGNATLKVTQIKNTFLELGYMTVYVDYIDH